MSERRRPIIDLGWMETLVVVTVAGVGGLVALLVIGLNRGEPVAFAVVGGLVTVFLMGLGAFTVILVLWFAHLTERGRERREQENFVNNARENLAIMQATARVQGSQNQMLLRQGRELARALPAPGTSDTLDLDALVFNDGVFEELED